MITINLKPISINKAWQGRRFKTKEYTKWRKDFGYLLKFNNQKKIIADEKNEYCIMIRIYLKNYKKFDIDNCIKPILDSLVENKTITDDRKITRLSIAKYYTDTEEKIEIE